MEQFEQDRGDDTMHGKDGEGFRIPLKHGTHVPHTRANRLVRQAPPEVIQVILSLMQELQRILGSNLIGLYVYGSLVTGDFDPATSDIDLLAALSDPLDEQTFAALKQMHDDLGMRYPLWANPSRIEVHYWSLAGLRTFKTQANAMAVISPGEPLHMIEAGRHYLLNLYVVQQHGLTLHGPAPSSLMEPISRAEFVASVREHVRQWPAWVTSSRDWRPAQAYAILTLCRALYGVVHGEQVSKLRAARWVQGYAPAWAGLIADALQWRQNWRAERGESEEAAAAFPNTVRFVEWVVKRIVDS